MKSQWIAGENGLEASSLSGGAQCQGINGFGDVIQGAQVKVTDENQKLLGIGALGQGTYDNVTGYCTFTFTVSGVAGGHPFYGVEVSRRGSVMFKGDSVKSASLPLVDQ